MVLYVDEIRLNLITSNSYPNDMFFQKYILLYVAWNIVINLNKKEAYVHDNLYNRKISSFKYFGS